MKKTENTKKYTAKEINLMVSEALAEVTFKLEDPSIVLVSLMVINELTKKLK